MSRFVDSSLVHGSATAESLAIARIWVFGIWTVLALLNPVVDHSIYPRELRAPIGIFHLLPASFAEWLATGAGGGIFKAALVTSAAAAALGVFTRGAMLVATLLVVIWQTEARIYIGSAGHAELGLVFAAFVLAIAPSNAALTLRSRRQPDPDPASYQFTLVAIMGLVCLIYLFIGAFRLTHGGPALFASTALGEWIISWNIREPDPANTLGALWVANPVTNALGRAGFGFLTLLEVVTPLCILSGRFRAVWLPTMLMAHAGILILMRIDFTLQVLCYLFFIDSRHWSPARARSTPAVVYFDGVCGLCNRFVDFVLARDRARRFRFAPLQGATAANRFGDPGVVDPASIVYEEGGVLCDRSTAALRIVAGLGGIWSLVAVFGLVPRPIRDAVYDWVARHRYGWFGRREECRLPTPEERAVFLD